LHTSRVRVEVKGGVAEVAIVGLVDGVVVMAAEARVSCAVLVR